MVLKRKLIGRFKGKVKSRKIDKYMENYIIFIATQLANKSRITSNQQINNVWN